MTHRDSVQPLGTPTWADLAVTDLDRSKAFYGAVFGWEFETSGEEYGYYTNATKDGRTVAALSPAWAPEGAEPMPNFWSVYFATDDAVATAEQIKQLGGGILFEPMQVGAFGSMCVATDADGAVFGLWQGGEHTGFQTVEEPGAVSWVEAAVRDADKDQDFYHKLFGWTFQPMGGGYSVVVGANGNIAGMMQMNEYFPAEMPSSWGVYFEVADCDAAVATVGELGGAVLQPAQDTPFGRVARVTGPDGEPFTIHQRAAA